MVTQDVCLKKMAGWTTCAPSIETLSSLLPFQRMTVEVQFSALEVNRTSRHFRQNLNQGLHLAEASAITIDRETQEGLQRQRRNYRMKAKTYTLFGYLCVCVAFAPAASSFLSRDQTHSHPRYDPLFHLLKIDSSGEHVQKMVGQWNTRNSNSTGKLSIATRIAEKDMFLVYTNSSIPRSNSRRPQGDHTLQGKNYSETDDLKKINDENAKLLAELMFDAGNQANELDGPPLHHRGATMANNDLMLTNIKVRSSRNSKGEDFQLINEAQIALEVAREAARNVHQMETESRVSTEIADRKIVAAGYALRIAEEAVRIADLKPNTFNNAAKVANDAVEISCRKTKAARNALNSAIIKTQKTLKANMDSDCKMQDAEIAIEIVDTAVSISEYRSNIADLSSKAKVVSIHLEEANKAVTGYQQATNKIASEVAEVGTKLLTF